MTESPEDKVETGVDSIEDKAAKAQERVAARLASLSEAGGDIAANPEVESPVGEVLTEAAAAEDNISALLQTDTDSKRGEVTAATLGRMMGLVTNSEFRVLEGKVDLLATRMNKVLLRLEKIMGAVASVPTGSDLERIDVQVGALRTMLRESMEELTVKAEEAAKQAAAPPVQEEEAVEEEVVEEKKE